MQTSGSYTSEIKHQIAAIYKQESRRVLATLIRILGDFDRAEEALQEAFHAALTKWSKEGIPQNPVSWLISAGKFKAIDSLRHDVKGEKLALAGAAENNKAYSEFEEWDHEAIKDNQLRLIFTCCHPSVPLNSRIPLALREVCGLSTEEIARAYLVAFETMKKRISRAKAIIREKRIPYEIPSKFELANRLDAVLHVIYLIFNEGYSATSGESHIKTDFTSEALFLAREMVRLLPGAETGGLLALLLLHESRKHARVDTKGDLIALEHQDRTKWVRENINEAYQLLQKSFMTGKVGQYTIQAAIASVHAAAESVEKTNWELIVGYYDLLKSMSPSPVIELQRAVALGMRDGPEKGFEIVSGLILDGGLKEYHPAYAVQADFAEKIGDFETAVSALKYALIKVRQEPEKRYLQKKLKKVENSLNKLSLSKVPNRLKNENNAAMGCEIP